ncbi:hypothetical protein [Photobacterium leiognathi]|nr:hypothetical protein [Photobacterium leiognathi]
MVLGKCSSCEKVVQVEGWQVIKACPALSVWASITVNDGVVIVLNG